ncbi:hypothetical protein M0P65_03815 [Candidatus Gracilibacteria bacterium]|nr:hypothetical protein [Candidatus Gracilibacteria bacterium]
MSKLEEWFFAEPGKTLMSTSDPIAEKIAGILGKGVIKGDHILKGGLPSKYSFSLDNIYSNKDV